MREKQKEAVKILNYLHKKLDDYDNPILSSHGYFLLLSFVFPVTDKKEENEKRMQELNEVSIYQAKEYGKEIEAPCISELPEHIRERLRKEDYAQFIWKGVPISMFLEDDKYYAYDMSKANYE